MAALAVTNTFSPGTIAKSNDVNTNFSDIVNYINNRNAGSATWDTVQATSATTVPLIINNSSGTQNIANFQDNGTNVLTIGNGGTTTITAINGGSDKTLILNNGTSTGNIFEVQDNGTAFLTIADGGTTTSTKTWTWTTATGTAFRDSANAVTTTIRYVIDSFQITGDSANGINLVGNISLNPVSAAQYGSGQGVLAIGNAGVTPSGTPSNGGILYVQAGALKYKGSSGTVTTLGNA